MDQLSGCRLEENIGTQGITPQIFPPQLDLMIAVLKVLSSFSLQLRSLLDFVFVAQGAQGGLSLASQARLYRERPRVRGVGAGL